MKRKIIRIDEENATAAAPAPRPVTRAPSTVASWTERGPGAKARARRTSWKEKFVCAAFPKKTSGGT